MTYFKFNVNYVTGVGTLKMYFNDHKNDELIICNKILLNITVDEAFLNFEDISRPDRDEFYYAEFVKRTIKWLRCLLSGLNCLSWLIKEEIVVCCLSLSEDR